MRLWTLFGLREGKATTPWPFGDGGDGGDGQQGVLGMPRYRPELCREGCADCAEICPTQAITIIDAAGSEPALEIDYGRCVVCQLCTEICPTGALAPSSDWAFGVRRREDLVWQGEAATGAPVDAPRARVRPQPAYPACRCRLVQRLRIRAARAEQPVLQSAPARHLFHRLAALCRSAAGHRSGHPRDGGAAARGL